MGEIDKKILNQNQFTLKPINLKKSETNIGTQFPIPDKNLVGRLLAPIMTFGFKITRK